jgi:hypothetical protein
MERIEGTPMNESVIHASSFTMDSLPNMFFEGYSDGSDWNGWACPYFEKAEAERVLAASEPNGFVWQFDETQDAFVVRNSNDDEEYEPEIFEGTILNIDGNMVKVYIVGGYSWIWEEADKKGDGV